MLCLGLAFIVSQIQELNADRAGLYASKSFSDSIKASLKISAGNVDKFGEYNYKDYLKQAENLIRSGKYFDMEDLFRTHPIESLRVKALEFFYHSDFYSDEIEKNEVKYILDSFPEELANIVPYVFTLARPAAYRLKRIIIDQMLQAAKSDYQVVKDEIEIIVQVSEWMDAKDVCFTEFKNQLGWILSKDEKGKLVVKV